MPDEPGAVLIAEIGSNTTRVTLVDAVAGEARLIGQAEVPSTTEPPYENAVVGILEATAQIGEATGRQLLQDDGTLLVPQTSERDGVSSVIALTSAAGLMGLVITAVASEVSARSALHASRATYTSVLQVVTLDDSARAVEGQDTSWIERQVQALVGLRPDIVLMTGGLDGGTEDALVRLAHIVGMTALNMRVDTDGQQRHDVAARPVIFAGNSTAREQVIEALSGRAELTVVDNVRPLLDVEQLDPARRALTRRYNDQILPKLPGMGVLRRMCARPPCTASDAAGLMTRFISQQYHRSTLTLDAGSAHTAAYLYSQGRYSPAVLGGVGTGYSAGVVLAERGLAAIMRWLPFPISERDLTHWLLNKMLRPHVVPTTREDVLIEHAVAREALALALEALWDERPGAPYDFVVASGGVLAHAPHPGLAALTILDALQPDLDQTELAVELHLDTLGLLGACGALAFVDPASALMLLERDLLNNTPLATCVVALGGGRGGETAIEAELVAVSGGTQRVTVRHGQIGCLALPLGQKGTLTLRPASGVRIGLNAPGKEVASRLAAIGGSALGVIIDARGRPLPLPDTPIERQQLLWDWLTALGVESGPLPYAAAEPLPEIFAPSLPPITDGAVPVPSDASAWVAQPPRPSSGAPPPEPAPELDSLARLRQTVEPPKKRGFLRRK
jgi:MutL-like protein